MTNEGSNQAVDCNLSNTAPTPEMRAKGPSDNYRPSPPLSRTKWMLAMSFAILSQSSTAGQFDSIIDAVLIPTKADQTNNDWSSTAKIVGVKWKWPYYESGAHDSTMVGTTKVGKDKNPNIGATTVTIEGARTFIDQIHIIVSNEELDIKAFGKGQTTKLKTSCDQEDGGMTVALYTFGRPGFKPLYMSYQSSWGASGSGGVEWGIANNIETALGVMNGCKLLN